MLDVSVPWDIRVENASQMSTSHKHSSVSAKCVFVFSCTVKGVESLRIFPEKYWNSVRKELL